MKLFNRKPDNKIDHWLLNISVIAGFLWLSIVFLVRKIFAHYHWNMFLLGILPNFFAGIGMYLFLYLKTKSRIKSAIIALILLSLAELIQLFTPRTADWLDILATILGVACAEIIRLWVIKFSAEENSHEGVILKKSKKIFSKGKWKHDGLFEGELYSTLFKQHVTLHVSFEAGENKKSFSEKTLATIEEFQDLKDSEINIIYEEIWKHCLACNQDTRSSYDGGITWVESKLEDHLAYYNIKNKEDAVKQTTVKDVYIANNWGVEERVFWLSITTSWDPEHAMIFNYQNGTLRQVE